MKFQWQMVLINFFKSCRQLGTFFVINQINDDGRVCHFFQMTVKNNDSWPNRSAIWLAIMQRTIGRETLFFQRVTSRKNRTGPLAMGDRSPNRVVAVILILQLYFVKLDKRLIFERIWFCFIQESINKWNWVVSPKFLFLENYRRNEIFFRELRYFSNGTQRNLSSLVNFIAE